MTRKEQIKSAYKLTGSNAGFYDGMMTYSNLSGKTICRLIWNMNQEKNLRYIEQALSGVPEDFAGKLLEVPVGTGVLTMPVYKDLPDADITCLDYSADMMNAARKKAEAAGIKNITFRQGDVGALPFDDGSFDTVLSLNGFHHLYVRKGFFTPPFETEDSLRKRLSDMYEKVNVTTVEGIGCFRCRKKA